MAAKDRFANLDAIRAVAILSVILYHYTARFAPSYTGLNGLQLHVPYGWLGVDVFFVLSGYCLGMTLGRAKTATEFVAMRIARIQPAYWLAVIMTFVSVYLIGLPGREVTFFEATLNLFWINALPALDIRHVDGAYWSLVVELKFYLWIGILLRLFGKANLPYAWGVLTLLGNFILLYHPQIGELVFIAPYAPMFLLGMIALHWLDMRGWAKYAFLIGALFIILYSKRMEEIPILGCLVAVGTMMFAMKRNIWVPRPLCWIGLISYPLYLIHQNIGLIIIRSLGGVDPYLRIVIAAAVVTLLASAIHYSIEIRYQKQIANKIVCILTGVQVAIYSKIVSGRMLSLKSKSSSELTKTAGLLTARAAPPQSDI